MTSEKSGSPILEKGTVDASMGAKERSRPNRGTRESGELLKVPARPSGGADNLNGDVKVNRKDQRILGPQGSA